MRVEVGELGLELTRSDAGLAAAVAVAAAYGGERTISLGFGGVRIVREGAVSRLLRGTAPLVERWGSEARIELRNLPLELDREAA